MWEYSPSENKAKFIDAYSTLYPETNSASASGKSKGCRFVSANIDTKKIINKRTGYIAKLNKDKTEILNVYIDRKTAANKNGYVSSTSLDMPFKNKTISRDHYYMLFEECDKNLTEAFIKKHGTPILYHDGIGQYDTDNKLIKEFQCKFDCCKMTGMSDKTLRKALTTNKQYNKIP